MVTVGPGRSSVTVIVGPGRRTVTVTVGRGAGALPVTVGRGACALPETVGVDFPLCGVPRRAGTVIATISASPMAAAIASEALDPSRICTFLRCLLPGRGACWVITPLMVDPGAAQPGADQCQRRVVCHGLPGRGSCLRVGGFPARNRREGVRAPAARPGAGDQVRRRDSAGRTEAAGRAGAAAAGGRAGGPGRAPDRRSLARQPAARCG